MMDCREFQDIVAELASGRLQEQEQEQRARVHAGQCSACARRLSAEARLAVRLAVLKSEESTIEAPYYLQSSLLAEFQKVHAPAPRVIAHEPKPIRQPRPISQSKLAWWSIAAAAAAVALAVWSSFPGSTPQRESVAARAPRPSQEAATRQPATQLAEPTDEVMPQKREQPQRDLRLAIPEASLETAAETQTPAARNEPPMPAASQPDEAVSDTAGRAMAASASSQEFVTEFVPLTFGGQAIRPAEVRLVRVKLPSTALAYFGLPAAPEAVTVDADVIVGDDGMAQALRFVRPAASFGPAGTRNSRELQRD